MENPIKTDKVMRAQVIRFVTKLHPRSRFQAFSKGSTGISPGPKKVTFSRRIARALLLLFCRSRGKRPIIALHWVPWPCDNEDLASFPIQLINRNNPPLGQRFQSSFSTGVPCSRVAISGDCNLIFATWKYNCLQFFASFLGWKRDHFFLSGQVTSNDRAGKGHELNHLVCGYFRLFSKMHN